MGKARPGRSLTPRRRRRRPPRLGAGAQGAGADALGGGGGPLRSFAILQLALKDAPRELLLWLAVRLGRSPRPSLRQSRGCGCLWTNRDRRRRSGTDSDRGSLGAFPKLGRSNAATDCSSTWTICRAGAPHIEVSRGDRRTGSVDSSPSRSPTPPARSDMDRQWGADRNPLAADRRYPRRLAARASSGAPLAPPPSRSTGRGVCRDRRAFWL